MADEDDSSEKPFDATPKKLDDARKRGEVPLSQDVLTASVYLGILGTGFAFGLSSISGAGSTLMQLLATPDALSEQVFSGGGTVFLGSLMAAFLSDAVVWFAIPFCFALLAAIAQQALVFAPTKLAPKLSRISPLSIAKQKFGRDGLFNFAKSFVKLCVFGIVLGMVLFSHASDILIAPALPFNVALGTLVRLCFVFLSVAFAVTLTIGTLDYLWQRAEHSRKHRMSLKEMRDESKESEGDPHTKQARRQRGYEIANNRMLSEVPTADVVIVNPTHYAVALKWSRNRGAAPVCVAKGLDEVAKQIRLKAIEAGVPIQSDPPTARALYATVDLGREIPRNHYRAVAAAIRFADALRDKARTRRRR